MKKAEPLKSDKIGSTIAHHDLTSVPIPSEWVNGETGHHSGSAMLGCPFMAGTAEGSPHSFFLVRFIELLLSIRSFLNKIPFKTKSHGNKSPCIDLTHGRVFGYPTPGKLPIPGWMDSGVALLRFWSRNGVFNTQPMSPNVMPIQLFRIGELAFASLPGEFTTQAGVRTVNLLLPLLQKEGIEKVIANGYANSYAGYITTPEEYELQYFEGACTHFGLYTLLAYLATFRQLALNWTRSELPKEIIPELEPPARKSDSYLKNISADTFLNRIR
jgi:neutral ceramidase